MTEDVETKLRNEILELTKRFYKATLKNDKFEPGKTKIHYAGRVYNEEEIRNSVDASLDFWLTAGRYCEQFEKEFAVFMGQKHCALVNSGSSANLVAVSCLTSKLMGKKRLVRGDKVVTVAVGFPTTVNPIFQNGLIPRFVDVELGTYNPTPEAIEDAIDDKTKAIILAHTLGNPFDAERIGKIARDHGIFFIEDCCDAVGSKLNGKSVGTFGDIATVSFYPAHHITMGEGGAVLTSHPILKKAIESFRDWGRSCFPAGMNVSTDKGVVPIETIVIGELVRTHTGKYVPVKETFKRKYSGKIVKIKPTMRPEIVATAEHPFLVKRNREVEWVQAQNLTHDDILLEAIPLARSSDDEQLVWSYKTSYRTKEEQLHRTGDLARLIGYWLAEGSLSSGLKGKSGYKENKYRFYRVDFSFHEDEKEYIEDVICLMQKYFGCSAQQKNAHGTHGIELEFKTRKGYEFFFQFFGRGAKNKHLPSFIMCWPADLTSELIRGYWRGDGSRSFQGFSMHSVSLVLIEQIRELLLRSGILASQWSRKPHQHHSSVVRNLKIESRNELHAMNIYGKNAERFGSLISDNYQAKSRRYYAWIENGYACYPIESIKYGQVSDLPVYNLEVDDASHSYHVNGVAVHNCWCPPGQSNTCGKRFSWKLGELPQGYDHKYIYSDIGYNLKITEMQAAVGVAQLKKLPEFIKKRKDNYDFFVSRLKRFGDKLILPRTISGADPSPFGFIITVGENAGFTKNEIVAHLESKLIETRVLFGGNLTKQPAYMEEKFDVVGNLRNSDRVMNDTFWIGVYPGITSEMREYIVGQICLFIEKNDKKAVE